MVLRLVRGRVGRRQVFFHPSAPGFLRDVHHTAQGAPKRIPVLFLTDGSTVPLDFLLRVLLTAYSDFEHTLKAISDQGVVSCQLLLADPWSTCWDIVPGLE